MSERENYYLLLELPLNPPEADVGKIEAAIQEKQDEWSRIRNHPTKGIIAQQYIGMIPDIRSVMSDEKLREKEAKRAAKIKEAEGRKAKREIDQHLSVLMSKGFISKKELKRLAEHHGVEERDMKAHFQQRLLPLKIDARIERMIAAGDIDKKRIEKMAKKFGVDPAKLRQRFRTKEADRETELEQYLNRCVTRGYSSNEEVAVLAKSFGMKPDAILHRIKCPVKKHLPKQTGPAETIDKTIEKIIREKLKIVDKKDLYDFLELPLDTELDVLKKRAYEKEGYIRRMANKDARATAGAALAGHCIAIFKNDKSRRAYDTSLTTSRMVNLDAELEVAGLNSRISPAVYQRLMRLGMRIGMDALDAEKYIQEYCRNRGWKIEKYAIDPEKKQLATFIIAGIVGLLLIYFVGGFAMDKYREATLRKNWEEALAKVKRQETLEGKEVILSNFVKYSADSDYKQQAHQHIQKIKKQIHDRDFKETVRQSDEKAAQDDFQAARDILNDFMTAHPQTPHAEAMNREFEKLTELADDAAFESLKGMASASMEERITAYEGYLARYPDGKHVDEVQEMRSSMIDGYLAQLESNLRACEGTGLWQNCIAMCEEFIEKFKFTDKAKIVKGHIVKYENQILRDKDVARLREKSASFGEDLMGARSVYLDFIEANPEMPAYMKEKLAADVKRLDARIAARDKMEADWIATETHYYKRGPSADKKISKINTFISQHPASQHVEKAREFLADLKKEKTKVAERAADEKEEKAWRKAYTSATNNRLSFDARLNALGGFLGKYPNSQHKQKAEALSKQIRAQKQRKKARQQAVQASRARVQQEMQRVASAIRASGRFRDNGNGTVTDTQTGRTWAMLDGRFQTGRCMEFQDAIDYAARLTTGGYSNWRVPTANELTAILTGGNRFPARTSTWYWTSDTFWHGWNKMAKSMTPGGRGFVVTEKPASDCGSVLVVR